MVPSAISIRKSMALLLNSCIPVSSACSALKISICSLHVSGTTTTGYMTTRLHQGVGCLVLRLFLFRTRRPPWPSCSVSSRWVLKAVAFPAHRHQSDPITMKSTILFGRQLKKLDSRFRCTWALTHIPLRHFVRIAHCAIRLAITRNRKLRFNALSSN